MIKIILRYSWFKRRRCNPIITDKSVLKICNENSCQTHILMKKPSSSLWADEEFLSLGIITTFYLVAGLNWFFLNWCSNLHIFFHFVKSCSINSCWAKQLNKNFRHLKIKLKLSLQHRQIAEMYFIETCCIFVPTSGWYFNKLIKYF